jgi:hypothetical protein
MKASIWRRNLRIYVSLRNGVDVFLGGVRIAPMFRGGDIIKLMNDNAEAIKASGVTDLAERLEERANRELKKMTIAANVATMAKVARKEKP